MKPEVTVVVPVYKRPQFIDALMESIFKQTLSNWELLFIDDGSDMPEITEICQRYERLDERVKYIRLKKNTGLAAAANRGTAEASAEFVAFLGDDDMAHPQWLDKHTDFMQRNPNIAASGCYRININESGKIIAKKYSHLVSEEVLIRERLAPPTKINSTTIGQLVFFRRDCLLAVGGYDEGFKTVEDTELMLRLEEKYPLAMLREELYYYRRTSGAHMSFNPMLWQYFCFAYVLAYFRRNGIPEPAGDRPFHLLPYTKNLPDAIISHPIFRSAKNNAKRLIKEGRNEELGAMLRDFCVAFSFSPKHIKEMRRYLSTRAIIQPRPSALPVIWKNLLLGVDGAETTNGRK